MRNDVYDMVFGHSEVRWEDLFGTAHQRDNCPETDLLEAVFETGIWDYLEGPGKTRRSKKIYEEAKRWIFAEPDIDDIRSFNFICEHVKKWDIVWLKEGLLKADIKLERGWKSSFRRAQEDVKSINPPRKRHRPGKGYRQRGFKGVVKVA